MVPLFLWPELWLRHFGRHRENRSRPTGGGGGDRDERHNYMIKSQEVLKSHSAYPLVITGNCCYATKAFPA